MLLENTLINSNTKDETSLAEVYFMQAEELRLESNYKESIDKYLHSILINKNNPAPYIGLAISYKELKNYNKAISNLEKANKLLPSTFLIQKELALCNIINGNFEDGIKYLMHSIKLKPDNIDIQMQLALVHEMIEEEDMALMIYQKIIETNPEYLRAYIQKATLYMHLEDYINSAKLFKKVIKLDSNYYRAYLALGICYEKLGNKSGAKRFYKKYLALSSQSDNYEEISKRIYNLDTQKTETNNLRII
ncbi:tetratricopeptide repeat protein [bacterium]|nr:tetratricopeptide repeat protein [bacterium]